MMENLYKDIKNAFIMIMEKLKINNEKVSIGASVFWVLFLLFIIPIVINYLANVELKNHIDLMRSYISIDTKNIEKNEKMILKLKETEKLICDSRLPINNCIFFLRNGFEQISNSIFNMDIFNGLTCDSNSDTQIWNVHVILERFAIPGFWTSMLVCMCFYNLLIFIVMKHEKNIKSYKKVLIYITHIVPFVSMISFPYLFVINIIYGYLITRFNFSYGWFQYLIVAIFSFFIIVVYAVLFSYATGKLDDKKKDEKKDVNLNQQEDS